jgi:hypothetical protein
VFKSVDIISSDEDSGLHMTTRVPAVVAAYIKAANACDSAAFLACFAPDALVNDVERDFVGINAIKSWSDREVLVLKDHLVLEIVEVTDQYGDIIAKTKVEGNFDKTKFARPTLHYSEFYGAKWKNSEINLHPSKSGRHSAQGCFSNKCGS